MVIPVICVSLLIGEEGSLTDENISGYADGLEMVIKEIVVEIMGG